MKRWSQLSYLMFVSVVMIFALVGCGPQGTTSNTPQVAGSDPSPTAEELPVPTSPVASSTTIETAIDEETPNKPDETSSPPEDVPDELISRSTTSLQVLSSYRYSALVRFEWTGEETVQSDSIEISGEFVFPNREHITWTNTGFGERFEVIRIFESAWLFEDGTWTEVPTLAVEGLMRTVILFAPTYAWESLASKLETASSFVGNEVVNGISALHYTSDYAGWEERFGGSLHTGHGDIWVAEEGFPVRCVFTGTGTDEEGHQGGFEWRMEITDVNQAISIEPPEI